MGSHCSRQNHCASGRSLPGRGQRSQTWPNVEQCVSHRARRGRRIALQTQAPFPTLRLPSNQSCRACLQLRFNETRVVCGDTDANRFVLINGVMFSVCGGCRSWNTAQRPIAQQINKKEMRFNKWVAVPRGRRPGMFPPALSAPPAPTTAWRTPGRLRLPPPPPAPSHTLH